MPAPSSRHIEPLLSLTPVPQNTVAPVVSGVPVVGQTLSTTDGSWDGSPSSFTRQWFRDGTPIGGATATTYVAASADISHVVTCRVTATGASGVSQPATSNGLTIVAEIADSDVQMWLSGTGLGGSPNVLIPSSTSVFDSVTHPESLAGDIEYRVVYLKNTHPVRSSTATVIWVQAQTTSPTTDIAIGVAPEPAGTDATAIIDEQTPPVGVSFTAPANQGAALSVGTLGPGQARGIWMRWTVLPTTADLPVDACTLDWDGIPG